MPKKQNPYLSKEVLKIWYSIYTATKSCCIIHVISQSISMNYFNIIWVITAISLVSELGWDYISNSLNLLTGRSWVWSQDTEIICKESQKLFAQGAGESQMFMHISTHAHIHIMQSSAYHSLAFVYLMIWGKAPTMWSTQKRSPACRCNSS